MSEARSAILASIRSSLGRSQPYSTKEIEALDRRLANPPVHVQPTFQEDLGERFVAKLEAVAGTVVRVPSVIDVPQAVMAYMEKHSLGSELVTTADPLLSEIHWPGELILSTRAAKRGDLASLTGAFAAVAETGSLVLLSSSEAPTTLSFLPDDHIVVLRRSQILSHIEDVWTLLRRRLARMPRTINFITGPSRTADVEQTIQLGAHGPRRLHVVLIQD